MKKRLLSLLLAIVMVIGLVPAMVIGVGAEGEPILPEEYLNVEYVQSNGDAYIDTGLKASSDMKCEVVFKTTAGVTGGIFGAWNSNNRFQVINDLPYCVSIGIGSGYSSFTMQDHDGIHTVVIDNTTASATFDGEDINESSGTFSAGTPLNNLFLFRSNQSGEAGHVKIYSAKIWNAGVLTHNYVPCYSYATDEYGMYDTVADNFLGNSGTGYLQGNIVPEGYSIVPFVASTGGAYIDTGIQVKPTTKCELVFKTSGADACCIFGQYTTGNKFQIIEDDPNRLCLGIGNGYSLTQLDSNEDYHTVVLDNATATATVDGEAVVPVVGAFCTASADKNLYLFNTCDNAPLGHVTIKSAKIWENGVLTNDLLPCYSEVDDEYGMYDMISDEFFGNDGDGQFVCGELPAEYTEVPYLVSDGNAYIDTGIVSSTITKCEVVLKTTGNEHAIFGAYNPNNKFQIIEDDPNRLCIGIGEGYSLTEVDENVFHTVTLNNVSATVSIDGENIEAIVGNFSTSSVLQSLYLFDINNNAWKGSAIIHSFKAWQGDRLSYDFVACYSENDGEYGFYDVIGQNFYSNSGSGFFNAGGNTNTCDVKITAPEGSTLTVYNGFSGSTVINSISNETVGNNTIYSYSLQEGNYRFVVSKSGYYSLCKNFIVSNTDMLNEYKAIDGNPGEMAGTGYEATKTVCSYTDELLHSDCYSVDDLVDKYPNVLISPAFNNDKAANEYTTQAELETFINDLDDVNDSIYVYTCGLTAMNKPIKLVVFTKSDISEMTMEGAAAVVAANGKPTVYIEAQMHGNEASSAEAVLAMITSLDESYGEEILDNINVIIIPRLNPDGAESLSRANSSGADINREFLYNDYPEVQAAHNVYNLFKPEVTLCLHECELKNTYSMDKLTDVKLYLGTWSEHTADMTELGKGIYLNLFTDLNDDGIRVADYSTGNSVINVGCSDVYYGLRGSVDILVEVPGIDASKENLERRVYSHYLTIKSAIEYVSDNAGDFVSICEDQRSTLATEGNTFDENKYVSLQNGKGSSYIQSYSTPTINLSNGRTIDNSGRGYTYFYNNSLVSRVKPTAYVIPADVSDISSILSIMDSHDIQYYKLDDGSSALLKMYSGTTTTATVGDETEYTFDDGAYVFPMCQDSAIVLSLLMEPDSGLPAHKTSLVKKGSLSIDQVYRYENELSSGKIVLSSSSDPKLSGSNIKKSLSPLENININIKVVNGETNDISQYTDFVLVVEDSEGNEVTRVDEWKWQGNTRYWCALPVLPQDINTVYNIHIEAKNELGEDVHGETFQYGVCTYCDNQIAKELDNDITQELKDLCTSIKAYGAAAKAYFDTLN